jgi:hypothetical protein
MEQLQVFVSTDIESSSTIILQISGIAHVYANKTVCYAASRSTIPLFSMGATFHFQIEMAHTFIATQTISLALKCSL